MSDSSSEYETRAAIKSQVELARQARSSDRPSLTAFWPIGIYLSIVAAVVVGIAINGISSAHRTDPATTAALQRDAQRAALNRAPLGGTEGISHASPAIDPEEVQRRLCVTAESCDDVAVAPVRSKLGATAQLPTAP
jgi:hypothetical protein